jgi:hypothetical protein
LITQAILGSIDNYLNLGYGYVVVN